ncbi:MAG TPA: ATP-binding cassette domain-containing protein [Ilumatobacter sp.]|nr:ATP-binding cassette domain-containing protein [Ilumatobacter sp.]
MTTLLEAHGLTKRFVTRRNAIGRAVATMTAVDAVDLTVDAGRTVAVVGESGAGKSTLGRLVLRLIEPDEGTVEVEGRDITHLRRRQLRRIRDKMQMIFQDPFVSLDPRMSISAAVEEPLKLHTSLGSDARRVQVEGLLERVGIGRHAWDRLPHSFSGGQLQRVAIARALAADPKLVVCDEPVAALDVSIRAQVINLLRDLQRERGLGLIFISHDLHLVRRIADETIVMRHGSVVERGLTQAIFDSPREAYTRLLLDSVPDLDPAHRTARRPGVAGGTQQPARSTVATTTAH